MTATSAVGRIAAVVALAVAAVVAGLLLFSGGPTYRVTAEFENASQLVKGSEVVVGGVPAGKVTEIGLGDHGQALVTFTVDSPYAPLRQGTSAQIRSFSLSGIANRQLELHLPPPGTAGPELHSGATLPQSQTTSEVDLDQLFNTLDKPTIANFKHVIQGLEVSYEGTGPQANRGFHYLNPFLSTSRRTFDQLNADQPALERLLVDTSQLSGALAARAPELSALVHNANLSTQAIARRANALSAAVRALPGFMRHADTTFVNLRATLDDLDPLVDASKPVADRLGPFFHSFRAAAHDAVPTIADLDRTIARPGPQNDLTELTKDAVPLARAGVGSGSPDCGSSPTSDYGAAADGDFTQGALGEAVCSLTNGLPELAFFRPYTTELVGWFNDFGTSGVFDADGGIGRIGTTLNSFSLSTPNSTGLPQILEPALSAASTAGLLDLGNNRRCPGANERPAPDGSNPFTDNGTLACNPNQIPPGP